MFFIYYVRIVFVDFYNQFYSRTRARAGEKEPAQKKNRVARVLGLYFRSTTETIRLQLSLFTNYRNSYV